jgi:hypothetical protein
MRAHFDVVGGSPPAVVIGHSTSPLANRRIWHKIFACREETMASTKKTPVQRMMLYDPRFLREATAFVREDPGNNVSLTCQSLAELTYAFDSFEAVRYLLVNLHGGPGELQLFDKTNVSAASFSLPATRNPNFLGPGAQILFEGCNVGEGAAGDKFLDDIGGYLLTGKGGILGAATSATFDNWTNTGMPLWGELKVYRYDASGKRSGGVVTSAWDAFWSTP